MHNPEEIVRQYVLNLLTSNFGFRRSDIGYEFPLQLGSSNKRADLVVFFAGASHTQDNIFIIIECKRSDRDVDRAALAQLKSYMSASVNATYGAVASKHWRVIEKKLVGGRFQYLDMPALVSANGNFVSINYHAPQPISVPKTTPPVVSARIAIHPPKPSFKTNPTAAPSITVHPTQSSAVSKQVPIYLASSTTKHPKLHPSFSKIAAPYFAPLADNHPVPQPPTRRATFQVTPPIASRPNQSTLAKRTWRQYLVIAGVVMALGCGTCMFITTLLSRPNEGITRLRNAEPQAEAGVESAISFPPANLSDSVEISQPEPTVPLIPTYETQPAFATPAFVTFTPRPRATNTPEVSTMPEITVEATMPDSPVENTEFGIVQATQNINVRRLASTGANVVGILRPGDRVEIIGENADRSWLEVRLDADTTGWVAAFLIQIVSGDP